MMPQGTVLPTLTTLHSMTRLYKNCYQSHPHIGEHDSGILLASLDMPCKTAEKVNSICL